MLCSIFCVIGYFVYPPAVLHINLFILFLHFRITAAICNRITKINVVIIKLVYLNKFLVVKVLYKSYISVFCPRWCMSFVFKRKVVKQLYIVINIGMGTDNRKPKKF